MNNITEFSKMSKELGWKARIKPIPTVAQAKILRRKAKLHDREAFKEIFEIIRFAPLPKDFEAEALEIIMDSFWAFRGFWEREEQKKEVA